MSFGVKVRVPKARLQQGYEAIRSSATTAFASIQRVYEQWRQTLKREPVIFLHCCNGVFVSGSDTDLLLKEGQSLFEFTKINDDVKLEHPKPIAELKSPDFITALAHNIGVAFDSSSNLHESGIWIVPAVDGKATMYFGSLSRPLVQVTGFKEPLGKISRIVVQSLPCGFSISQMRDLLLNVEPILEVQETKSMYLLPGSMSFVMMSQIAAHRVSDPSSATALPSVSFAVSAPYPTL